MNPRTRLSLFRRVACDARSIVAQIALLSVLIQSARAVSEERAGKPILVTSAAPTTQASARPATVPSRNSYDIDIGRVFMALTGVITLMFMLRWGTKKVLPGTFAGGSRTSTIKILARCPLAPRQQIILLQIGKRIIVAADCASQLSSLCQITDADEVAALLGSIQQEKTSPSSAFSSWFTQARHAFGGDDTEKQTALPADQNADLEPPLPAREGERLTDLTARVRDLARQFRGPGNAA